MSRLSDKLKLLGVQIGARDLPSPQERNPHAIEHVVPGRFVETACGRAFVVEASYPLDHMQGRYSLRVEASLSTIAAWAGEPRLAQMAPAAFAFLDTETTGLARGTGTYAFMVGVGRYEGDALHVAQFFMRDPAEEPALLTALTEFLQPCQALVTFNGKGFDIPLLEIRYVTNGADSPFSSLAHLDLLPLARRLWRYRLASRALGSLEEHILGLPREEQDVPGWLIPTLYFDYLRDQDARPLKGIFYHNEMDVVSMAALLGHMADLLSDPFDPAVHALDLMGIGKLFQDLDDIENAVRVYRRGLGGELPPDVRWKMVERLSFLQKRCGSLDEAVALWEDAAEYGQLYAHVELAKFYEHVQRDYACAAKWTQRAIDLIGDSPYERQRWLADLEHRLARLHRKQQN